MASGKRIRGRGSDGATIERFLEHRLLLPPPSGLQSAAAGLTWLGRWRRVALEEAKKKRKSPPGKQGSLRRHDGKAATPVLRTGKPIQPRDERDAIQISKTRRAINMPRIDPHTPD